MVNLPKRPQEHILEDVAEQFCRQSLPAAWIIEKISKDYGIDFRVEITADNQVTGANFLIQLKGTENLSIRNKGYIAHTSESSTLEYFLQRPELVIYLVYDDKTKKGYWIWIQGYIRSELKSNWKAQKTNTIKIPLQNFFNRENIEHIKGRVLASHEQSKLLTAVQTLNHPFLNYSYEAERNSTKISVHPKYTQSEKENSIKGKIRFRFDNSPDAQKASQELNTAIKTGLPARIDNKYLEAFQITDFSPGLLPQVDSLSPGFIEIMSQQSEEKEIFKIFLLDQNRQKIVEIPYVEFYALRSGTEEITLSNEPQKIPLKIEFSINSKIKRFSIKFAFQFAGANAVQLKEICSIQDALVNCSHIKLFDIIKGVSILGLSLELKLDTVIDPKIKDFIFDLAYIQESLNKQIIVVGKITPYDIALAKMASQILHTGFMEGTTPIQDLPIFQVEKTSDFETPNLLDNDNSYWFSYEDDKCVFKLMETEIDFGPVKVMYKNVKFQIDELEELDKTTETSAKGSIILKLKPALDNSWEVKTKWYFHNWINPG